MAEFDPTPEQQGLPGELAYAGPPQVPSVCGNLGCKSLELAGERMMVPEPAPEPQPYIPPAQPPIESIAAILDSYSSPQ